MGQTQSSNNQGKLFNEMYRDGNINYVGEFLPKLTYEKLNFRELNSGNTPLRIICENNDQNIVEILLEEKNI
jgi:ankyrin repeat protein